MPLGTVIDFDDHVGLGHVEADDGAVYLFHCVEIADGTRTIDVGDGGRVRPDGQVRQRRGPPRLRSGLMSRARRPHRRRARWRSTRARSSATATSPTTPASPAGHGPSAACWPAHGRRRACRGGASCAATGASPPTRPPVRRRCCAPRASPSATGRVVDAPIGRFRRLTRHLGADRLGFRDGSRPETDRAQIGASVRGRRRRRGS